MDQNKKITNSKLQNLDKKIYVILMYYVTRKNAPICQKNTAYLNTDLFDVPYKIL